MRSYAAGYEPHPAEASLLAARRATDVSARQLYLQALVTGFPPEDAGVLASALQSKAVLALLAFDAVQVERTLRVANPDVMVIGPHGPPPRQLPDDDVPLITLGRRLRQPQRQADAQLEANASADEVVSRALSLITVNRAVALPAPLHWGPLRLDLGRRQAFWEQGAVRLTPIQFRILEVLVLAAGAVLSSSTLSRRIWGTGSFDDAERIQAHIRRIRRKIEPDPSRPSFLLTIRGEGYRLADWEVVEPAIDLTQFQLATTRR